MIVVIFYFQKFNLEAPIKKKKCNKQIFEAYENKLYIQNEIDCFMHIDY